MRNFFIIGAGCLCLSFFLYMAGCNSQGLPVKSTIPPTATATAITSATATPPPGSATFPTLYSDGGISTIVTATNSFSGGGSPGFPTLNAVDTTVGGYGTDHYGYLTQWTSTEVGAMSGYSGFALAGSSTNFSAYTTCTFWAEANESASVGFNAAEPSGDTLNVAKGLTTTWTQYSLTINGTRSDGFSSAGINAVSTYFVVVITAAPGTDPLNVSVDQVTFQ